VLSLYERAVLLRLQDCDERRDICETNNGAAIAICFGLENTGLQDGNEWWDICEVDNSVHVDITFKRSHLFGEYSIK